jgi:glucose-6-phosphate dehydrogenase assembly protein OpcA
VLPLLLPDVPVVTWWPGEGPKAPSQYPLGALAQRRVTDAAAGSGRLAARSDTYAPGDTDLAWTRLTPWRSLLAAALDQFPATVTRAAVSSEKGNPSADLLAVWLNDRLNVPVSQRSDEGPGITGVELVTDRGVISITRPDGALASLSMPGQPDRPVALRRRELADLVAEELRRLDPDDVYASVLKRINTFAPAPEPTEPAAAAEPAEATS